MWPDQASHRRVQRQNVDNEEDHTLGVDNRSGPRRGATGAVKGSG